MIRAAFSMPLRIPWFTHHAVASRNNAVKTTLIRPSPETWPNSAAEPSASAASPPVTASHR